MSRNATRRNFKDVTVSGRPPEIQSLEQFRVLFFQTAGSFTPTVDMFVSPILDVEKRPLAA